MRIACVLIALSLSASVSAASVSSALASELQPLWRAEADAATTTSVTYGRGGKTLLVSGMRGEVALWSVGEAKPRLKYLGPAGPVLAARFTDAGRTVTAYSVRERKLWRWDAASAAPLPPIDLAAVLGDKEWPLRFDTDASGVTGMIVSYTGLHLIPLDSQGLGQGTGRDVPRMIAAPEAKRPLSDAALSPDGRAVCAIEFENRIHCYNTGDGTLIASLSYELADNLTSIAILLDGALAVGTAQGYIARWKSTKGGYIDTGGFDVASAAKAVAVFPSKVFYAAGRNDGQINVFSPDLTNRAPRIELLGAKGSPVKMISINAEGQLAAAVGREIVVWDIGAELIQRGGKP